MIFLNLLVSLVPAEEKHPTENSNKWKMEMGKGGQAKGEGRKFTGNANELPRLHRDQFLLIQTGAPALDAVQILVHLVGAVEGDVQQHVGR